MVIKIDRDDNRALYLQVVDALRSEIDNGALQAHTRLPSSRKLAKELGVNRITVVNAYAELEAEGLVSSHVGSGTFVADLPEAEVTPNAKQPVSWRPPVQGIPRHDWSPNVMIREMMRLARHPGVINFASGAVASESLPVVEFRQALNEVLRRDGADALQYGDSIGHYELRLSIVRTLRNQGIVATPDDVLVTDGCQQALDLVLRVLGREGDAILVENPSYLGLLDVINSHHMTPIGVPIDEQGVVVDKLEPLILRYQPQLLYTVPNFQNPTGATMSLARRKALLALARKYNLPIVEDDIYRELYYDAPPPPTLAELDSGPSSAIFHVSSYSKMLIPGLRLGYMVAPPAFQERMIALKQAIDIASSPLNQRALNIYLESGHFQVHLQNIRQSYKERCETALEAAKTYLPAGATWQTPGGGLYLWIEMPPDGPKATDLYMKAVDYGVAFAIGNVFFAHNPSQYSMRLNYAVCSPDEIVEGMRRLGKAWQELLLYPPQQTARSRQSSIPIL